MMELDRVIFVYRDKRSRRTEKVTAQFTSEGWHQWGAITPLLGQNVPLVEAVAAALEEH